MSAVLVDSNVIIDLVAEPSEWSAWSEAALLAASDRGRLIINPIVFAEVSVGFEKLEAVDIALQDRFEREPIPYEAAFLAGKAYARYRKRSGLKRSPLPDFFIGAHAAVRGYELLTRDARRYRQYFPTLVLIAP